MLHHGNVFGGVMFSSGNGTDDTCRTSTYYQYIDVCFYTIPQVKVTLFISVSVHLSQSNLSFTIQPSVGNSWKQTGRG
jgi:hypothetical protein